MHAFFGHVTHYNDSVKLCECTSDFSIHFALCTAVDDLPKEWDPMPPKTSCLMVTLDVKSDEYSKVKIYFENTMSQVHRIIEIKRVQNPTLYKQYMVKKKDMDQRNPKTIKNERRLFHGCSGDVIEQISHLGFNRSFAGIHGRNCF